MTLAGTPIAYTFQSGSSRNGTFNWSDGVPGPAIRFDSTEEHQTVKARAGSVVRFRPPSTITLIDGKLELYRLDRADHAGDGEPGATRRLGGTTKGLDVPLPTEVGRWLLSVYSHWQTDCAYGDGYIDLLLITT